jgi:ribosomal protein L33
MAKKSARMRVGLVCTETKIRNYVTQMNLQQDKDKTFMKYCPALRKKTRHKVDKKLK